MISSAERGALSTTCAFFPVRWLTRRCLQETSFNVLLFSKRVSFSRCTALSNDKLSGVTGFIPSFRVGVTCDAA